MLETSMVGGIIQKASRERRQEMENMNTKLPTADIAERRKTFTFSDT